MNEDHQDMEITLPMLEQIELSNDLTQRSLSERLNLALGLTNSYLKRCIRKGFVKIEQVPANRYLYYLTPKGFAEKSRLAAKYLKNSFDFYRRASDDCFSVFQQCAEQGWPRVVICGVSDLAEIAIMQAGRAEVEVVGIFDERHKLESFFGVTVIGFDQLSEESVCMITSLNRPLRIKKQLLGVVPESQIFAPALLKL
ncbi:MAG: winged helix-turn-helix transcriptional regulator [Coxiellaceae bacterium]|nr:winged helix-turn-helix transcriptional regulator [Coxiellaceae bacterium]